MFQTTDEQILAAVTTVTHHTEFDALLIVLTGGRGLPRWIKAVAAAFRRTTSGNASTRKKVDSFGERNAVVAKPGTSNGIA